MLPQGWAELPAVLGSQLGAGLGTALTICTVGTCSAPQYRLIFKIRVLHCLCLLGPKVTLQ